jgi:hypothetical protein
VTFLPDPTLVYEGRRIDNHGVALKDDPLIEQFMKAAMDRFEVANRGELADSHGSSPYYAEWASRPPWN